MRSVSIRNAHPKGFIFLLLTAALACTVLLGWTLDIQALTQISPNWIAMQPLTATTLLLSVLALSLYAKRKQFGSAAFAILIALISTGVLLQHWTGLLPWLDEALFAEQVQQQKNHLYPGRTAEIAAIEFLLFVGYLAWPRTTPRLYRKASIIATTGFLIALVAMGGYFMGARDLSSMGGYVSLAAPTVLGFLLLFGAALLIQKDGNWAHLFNSPYSSHTITRGLLYIVVGWPLALAAIISAVDDNIGDDRLEFAIYTLCLAIGLAVAIVQFGKRLARTETQRNMAIKELEASGSRLALALEAGNSAVWEIEIETGRVIQSESPVYRGLGYELSELSYVENWMSLIHEEDRHIVMDALDDVVQGRQDTYRIEIRIKAKEGTWHWVLVHAIVAERNRQGKALRLVGTHTDITERKTAEEKVRAAALHDTLTGLPNRAFIFEFGAHLLAAAERTHQRCALLFIDLDRFKPINDIYGHHMGDQALQEVAKRLLAISRAEDLVGRLGGDEFVILLPHLDGVRHRAATVAQHVLESIVQPINIDTLSFSLSPSIGISYYPADASDMSGLVYTADLAMYLAKQNGRGNYQFYSRELEARAEEVYAMEASLKKALKDGGFTLFYQPVVDIKTGKLISAEALVRLADAEGNTISPQRFIPIAEAAGLIGEIGEWVAQEACRQHQAWLKENLNVTIAINVSPLQFRQAGFAEKIDHLIKSTGMAPDGLQIEVTEGAVMESVDDAVKILTKIKQLGVKVSLDDFGTGYSSLSRLSTLPLDKLKVDQSFVRKVETDAASRAVTETIISLGRSLNLEVIGEGIESEQTLRYLFAHGCDQAQGYWVSRPLPAQEFAVWCQQQLHLQQPGRQALH